VNYLYFFSKDLSIFLLILLRIKCPSELNCLCKYRSIRWKTWIVIVLDKMVLSVALVYLIIVFVVMSTTVNLD